MLKDKEAKDTAVGKAEEEVDEVVTTNIIKEKEVMLFEEIVEEVDEIMQNPMEGKR